MRPVRRSVAHRTRASFDAIAAPAEQLPGQLSTLAVQLHLCAALVAAFTDRPGFVSDAFLATIAEDITLAVIELSLTGRWQRNHDGYQIPPHHLRQVIAMLHDL